MNNKIKLEISPITGEKIYKTVLESGLRVYVCPRKGYSKKMGMFGTIFGSIDNEFVDIQTGKQTKVVDGIAHFLEHKLFEQEGANALDIFSKMGVDSNAYTSFDHTVYYFETDNNFEECVSKLIEFVSNPYFTNENVEKEKGIIAQEIKMYEDEPNAVVYFNLLKNMYAQNPINIDIAGTVESINKIDKNVLYKCYNTFYNIKNMFFIAIGDFDIEETLNQIEKNINYRYNNKLGQNVIRTIYKEQEQIVSKESEKKLPIAIPVISIGFKLTKKTGKYNVKNTIIADIINKMYFSNVSDFYEEIYKEGIVVSEPEFLYECGKDFSHIIISAYVTDVEKYNSKMKEHLLNIKAKEIDLKLYQTVKNKKKGELIYSTEINSWFYRSIIDSIVQDVNVFEELESIDLITAKDIKEFLENSIDFSKMSISKVVPT